MPSLEAQSHANRLDEGRPSVRWMPPLALIDPQEPLLKPETPGSRGRIDPQALEAINGGPNSWKPFDEGRPLDR